MSLTASELGKVLVGSLSIFLLDPEVAMIDWYGHVLISKCMNKHLKYRRLASFLPDLILQLWRKIDRRPGTSTTSWTGNGGLDL